MLVRNIGQLCLLMRGQKWLHPTSLASMLADHVSYRTELGPARFQACLHWVRYLGFGWCSSAHTAQLRQSFFPHTTRGIRSRLRICRRSLMAARYYLTGLRPRKEVDCIGRRHIHTRQAHRCRPPPRSPRLWRPRCPRIWIFGRPRCHNRPLFVHELMWFATLV